MTDGAHKFKVGQTVGLVPSTLRSAAKGAYRIVSLRLTDDGTTQIELRARTRLTSEPSRKAILLLRQSRISTPIKHAGQRRRPPLSLLDCKNAILALP